MSQVLEMEHLIDRTVDLLCKKLDGRFVETGATLDIADYVLYGESNQICLTVSAMY